MSGATVTGITITLFALTYFGLALGKVPGLSMDRAGIAVVGAVLMLVTGMLSLEQAVSTESIDYRTLFLLFGMMVVAAFLRLSGVFQHMTSWALQRIRTPLGLLAATVALSGILSAFLINDIVCLALTPLVLHLTRRLGFDPIPHLIGLATAANIGSAGTITGNPQNIYIGTHSGIAYFRFAERLLPVAILALVLNFLVIAFVYRGRLHADLPKEEPRSDAIGPPTEQEPTDSDGQRWLRAKSAAIALIMVVLFFVGFPLELVALGAAAVLLLGRTEPAKIYREIDWNLLMMFTGLFIAVHAFQVHVVSRWGIDGWDWLARRPVDLLSLVSAGLSNLVSNVPAVLLLEPVMGTIPEASRETAWLALAMSSTFAGNLTLLGSVANLIVAENARREGVTVTFREYGKVGVPLTILTLILGIVWLRWVRY